MEEILASIRRIISEGDEQEEGAEEGAADEVAEEAADAPEAAPEPDPEPEPEAVAEPEPMPEPMPEPEPDMPAAPESDDDDVLELTEQVADDETVVPFQEDAAPEPADEPDPLEEDSVEIEAFEEEPVAAAPAPEPVSPASLGTDDENLVAPPVETAATASLAGLAAAVASQHGMPVGGGNRTLEDLVKEVMRPMVKEWLDNNLQSVVERLVDREISRMSRRAEDDTL